MIDKYLIPKGITSVAKMGLQIEAI